MTLFRIIVRTPEEKADLEGGWARSDEDFFAAGACHVLAGAFLEAYPQSQFRPFMIQPARGFRSGHVVVASDTTAFDCRGFSPRAQFLSRYAESCQVLFSGWSYELVAVHDPIGWDFCRAHHHRHPSQFFRDALPRARAFLRRFAPP